jgi:hypothetical protein
MLVFPTMLEDYFGLMPVLEDGGVLRDWPGKGRKSSLRHPGEVAVDPKTWEHPEVTATCSATEGLFALTSMEGKGRQVPLSCRLKNLTDKVLALPSPNKNEALFRLPDGRVIRSEHTFLGSDQHEIPAHGETHAGLFPGNKDCPVQQSDGECVQSEVKGAMEMLLTDSTTGVRFYVRIE